MVLNIKLMKRKIAQSSLEYGAFFAFALMIGLIIISLLGDFSLFGSEGDIQKSQAYWYAKKPIGIEDLLYYDDGTVYASLRNKDIENLYVENVTTTQGVLTVKKTLTSGDAIVANGTDFPKCNSSNLEQVKLENIVIYYKRPGTSSYLSETGREKYYSYCIKAPDSTSTSTGGGSSGGCAGTAFIYLTLLFVTVFSTIKRR